MESETDDGTKLQWPSGPFAAAKTAAAGAGVGIAFFCPTIGLDLANYLIPWIAITLSIGVGVFVVQWLFARYLSRRLKKLERQNRA